MTTLEVPRGVDDDVSGEQVDFSASDITTELGAPWGLARISHRNRLTLSTFQKYIYYSGGGEGVTAYVIDTGINIEHVEFQGRASWGKTIPKTMSTRTETVTEPIVLVLLVLGSTVSPRMPSLLRSRFLVPTVLVL